MDTLLSNCHTHTQFCDGKSTMEEMVLSALQKGFVSLGFTPHARQYFGLIYSMSAESENACHREFDRLNLLYHDKIRLYLGVERDLYAASDCREYDYMIGSVHYLPSARGLIAVDSEKEKVLHLLQAEYHSDPLLLAQVYFRSLSAMATATRPAIVAHFDLFLKHLRGLIDTSSPAYCAMADEALEAVLDSGAILEVNTGGMVRSGQPFPYPEPRTLSRWHGMGGSVTVSSDCHQAGYLDACFPQMPDYLRAAGFSRVLILNPLSGPLFKEIEI